MTLTLPYPAQELHPNARKDRRYITDIRQKARFAGMILAREYLQHGGIMGDHLIMTFCPPDMRRRDLDNAFAACKAALDGIAAEFRRDDQHWTFTLLRGPCDRRGGHVEIVFVPPPAVVPLAGWVT